MSWASFKSHGHKPLRYSSAKAPPIQVLWATKGDGGQEPLNGLGNFCFLAQAPLALTVPLPVLKQWQQTSYWTGLVSTKPGKAKGFPPPPVSYLRKSLAQKSGKSLGLRTPITKALAQSQTCTAAMAYSSFPPPPLPVKYKRKQNLVSADTWEQASGKRQHSRSIIHILLLPKQFQ